MYPVQQHHQPPLNALNTNKRKVLFTKATIATLAVLTIVLAYKFMPSWRFNCHPPRPCDPKDCLDPTFFARYRLGSAPDGACYCPTP